MNATQKVPPLATESPIDSRYYLAPFGGAGWLAGIWIGSILLLNPWLWLALSIPLLLAAIYTWRRGRAGLLLASLVALTWGAARYSAGQPVLDAGQINFYNGAKDVWVVGDVVTEPDVRDTGVILRVETRELVMDGREIPVSGTIFVRTGRYSGVTYGSTLRLTGDLEDTERLGSSSYARYLERQGIFSAMTYPAVEVLIEGGGSPLMRLLLHIKERGRAVIATILPEPHAALLTGILLGDDSGMPRTLQEDFRRTGMTHIIAISGFNIAVLIGLLDHLTGPILPRRSAAVAIMIILGLYAILVGAAASVIRATIMGMTYLVGLRLMGRPTMVIAGLFVASFLMTLIQPQALWDIGFQLSFAATLGLMLYAGRWTRRLGQATSVYMTSPAQPVVMRLMTEAVIVTVAAQVLTLPLILYHFGRLSLASLPANIFVIPIQPAVMMTGGLALLIGYVLPSIGRVMGLVAWLFLNYTITVIRVLAQLPGASVPFLLSAWGLVAVYLAIGAITVMAADKQGVGGLVTRAMPRERAGKIALGGGLLVLLLFVTWLGQRPDGRLHVAFLDVGQGDAIFIQTPDGRQMLIDGGRYPSVTLEKLGQQMPFWDRTIDIVMVTHPDVDHVSGLVSVLERYQVSMLITNGAENGLEPAYDALLAAAGDGGSLVHVAQVGETILLDGDIYLEILHAGVVGAKDNRNDASIVARLTYGSLSVLLAGDAEAVAEDAMLRSGKEVDAVILKAGHHGANTSSSERFLNSVSPQVVVISAGRDNSYGHPHPAMLERATAVGATIMRTDQQGTLVVKSDGQQMWWEAELPSN